MKRILFVDLGDTVQTNYQRGIFSTLTEHKMIRNGLRLMAEGKGLPTFVWTLPAGVVFSKMLDSSSPMHVRGTSIH